MSRKLHVHPYKLWLGQLPQNFRCTEREVEAIEFDILHSKHQRENNVAVAVKMPRRGHRKSNFLLLGAEFKSSERSKLRIEFIVSHVQRDSGISRGVARNVVTYLRLLHSLEPTMFEQIGSGVISFNHASRLRYAYDENFSVTLAILVLRLLSRTDYADLDDTQVIQWMLNAPFPMKDKAEIKRYQQNLHAIMLGNDIDLAVAAFDLIEVLSDEHSAEAINDLMLKRRDLRLRGTKSLKRIGTVHSKGLAQRWIDRDGRT
ncbi:MAG: hypothetical protein AAFV98_15060 [Chloroflexota bacterium]